MASEEPTAALTARRGHFRLESGHHGDRWFGLDALFLRPQALGRPAADLARLLAAAHPEVICGPLVGGAFLAQLVAAALGAEFVYTERSAAPAGAGLYGARYHLPTGLRASVHGRRVAIVDDIINAGSAIRATAAELAACGARTVAFGALLTLGTAGADFAAGEQLPLMSLAQQGSGLWSPEGCPLCAAGIPLEEVGVTP